MNAAVALGVSETYLKRLCRLLKIHRWPYRKIQALLNQKHKMQIRCKTVAEPYKKNWKVKIAVIDARIAQLREYGEETKKYKRVRVQKYKEKSSDHEDSSEEKCFDSESSCSSPDLPHEDKIITPKCNVVDYWQDTVAPLGFKLDLDLGSLAIPQNCEYEPFQLNLDLDSVMLQL
jgi:hypothetical protein